MQFKNTAIVLAFGISSSAQAQELPITTTDVFIQSGEVSATTINIMARCNTEQDSNMVLTIDGDISATAQSFEARDYTHTFHVTGLESNTMYTYKISCDALDESGIVESTEGSFKTAPAADEAVAFNFVWAADLAGQG